VFLEFMLSQVLSLKMAGANLCLFNPFATVCELDLVFSLHKSLLILFEMFIGGMLCESNKREVLKAIVEAEELVEEMTKPGEDTASQLDDGLSFQEQFQLGRTPGRRQGNSGPGRR